MASIYKYNNTLYLSVTVEKEEFLEALKQMITRLQRNLNLMLNLFLLLNLVDSVLIVRSLNFLN